MLPDKLFKVKVTDIFRCQAIPLKLLERNGDVVNHGDTLNCLGINGIWDFSMNL